MWLHVFLKTDYCSSLLSGPCQYIMDKLSKVRNSAARLVLKYLKHDHIQPLLCSIHWLPVHLRIKYKSSTLCFSIFIEASPIHLSQLLTVYTPSNNSVLLQTCRLMTTNVAGICFVVVVVVFLGGRRHIFLYRPSSVELTAL